MEFYVHAVELTEHEFGQRGMGWRLYPTEKAAREDMKPHSSGAPGQYFSEDYEGLVQVTERVHAAVQAKGRLRGKGNYVPDKKCWPIGEDQIRNFPDDLEILGVPLEAD